MGADIYHDFPIAAPAADVFAAVATPKGLDAWWTERSSGRPEMGTEYQLVFGEGYDWRARVSRCYAPHEFELTMTRASDDWIDSRVGFTLSEHDGRTQVRFHHTGWPEVSDHYRTSSYCWAMYLRLLRLYVERGEIVPYKDRLDA